MVEPELSLFAEDFDFLELLECREVGAAACSALHTRLGGKTVLELGKSCVALRHCHCPPLPPGSL